MPLLFRVLLCSSLNREILLLWAAKWKNEVFFFFLHSNVRPNWMFLVQFSIFGMISQAHFRKKLILVTGAFWPIKIWHSNSGVFFFIKKAMNNEIISLFSMPIFSRFWLESIVWMWGHVQKLNCSKLWIKFWSGNHNISVPV